jgi:hypothetical protein
MSSENSNSYFSLLIDASDLVQCEEKKYYSN